MAKSDKRTMGYNRRRLYRQPVLDLERNDVFQALQHVTGTGVHFNGTIAVFLLGALVGIWADHVLHKKYRK